MESAEEASLKQLRQALGTLRSEVNLVNPGAKELVATIGEMGKKSEDLKGALGNAKDNIIKITAALLDPALASGHQKANLSQLIKAKHEYSVIQGKMGQLGLKKNEAQTQVNKEMAFLSYIKNVASAGKQLKGMGFESLGGSLGSLSGRLVQSKKLTNMLSSSLYKLGPGPQMAIVALIALGHAIGEEFVARLNEGREVMSAFGGTTLRSSMGLTNSVSLMNQWAYTMTFWGVSSKQSIAMLNTLTKSYALQGEIGGKTGNAVYAQTKAMGGSLAAFMSMSRVSGINEETTNALASNMMLMHTRGTMLDNDFAIMAGQASLAGVNVADLGDAFTKLVPSMMMTGKNTVSITRGLSRYAEAITKSNASLFDGVNKFAMAQKAMQGFADVASGMDVSMLMAFGDGMGKFQGSLDQMVETAVKSDRLQTMANYMGKLVQGVPESQKFATAFFAIQAQGIKDVNQAAAMAKSAVSGVDLKSDRTYAEQQAANQALQELTTQAQASLPVLTRLGKAALQFIAACAPLITPIAYTLEVLAKFFGGGRAGTVSYSTPSNPA